MYDYDVVFLGSGHAAWHGATILARAGKRVAMVEANAVAGTCVNWGCNAKILIDTPFELMDGLENYVGHGVEALPRMDWESLVAYKRKSVRAVRESLEATFVQEGIEVLHGRGHLLDEHVVAIEGRQAGTVCAEYVVICTGCRPARCDVPGGVLLHDSRDFMDLSVFPRRVAFIGAGLISMEFACIAAKLGVRPLVVEKGDRILPGYPRDYVECLVKKMNRDGVNFLLGEQLASVERTKFGIRLTMESGDDYEVDYAVCAMGRVANVEDLGLERLGVACDERGIKVDEFMRTTVPNVFATGDCVRKSEGRLTPTAEFESVYVARQILGSQEPLRYPAIPNVAYTLPRIAQCGVTVDDALARPDDYRVERVPFGKNLTFMAKGDLLSDFTFVLDKDGCLVGCAVMGADAEDLINVAALVMNQRLGRAQLEDMVFAFPTTSYGFISALAPLLA